MTEEAGVRLSVVCKIGVSAVILYLPLKQH